MRKLKRRSGLEEEWDIGKSQSPHKEVSWVTADQSSASRDKNLVKHWERGKSSKGAIRSKYVARPCAHFITLLFNRLLTLLYARDGVI